MGEELSQPKVVWDRRDEVQIVDVRESYEWEAGRIEGAVHVPLNDLMAGEVHLMFDNLSSIGAHARAGRVRGIAVSGARRSTLFPELPTLHEAGVTGYETLAWGGVIGPANLPRDVVGRLNSEIKAALASPAVLERFKQLDTEPDGGMPEEFMALVRSETPKWADVIKRSGAKVD